MIGHCERCGELHELEWIHSVNRQLCADCTLHLILNGGLDERQESPLKHSPIAGRLTS